MTFIRLSIFSVFLMIWGTLPVYAQEKKKSSALTDEFVQGVLKETRPRVKDLMISNDKFVGPETAEQLADPLLNTKQARRVIGRGLISGMAEWCKIDWRKKSFEPFMAQNRMQRFSEKQLAYIGMLHGYGMGVFRKSSKSKKCDEADLKRVHSYLGD